MCVAFCDCQSQNTSGFWIDSYDRKVSVKWAAFLLAVSSFWFACELYRSLFNSPQFLTASKPSEFSPTLTSTIEQTIDDGRLCTGPNARNWPASQDATKQKCLWQGCIKCMSTKYCVQLHLSQFWCSPWMQFSDTMNIYGYFEMICDIQHWHMSSQICYNYEAQFWFISGAFIPGEKNP